MICKRKIEEMRVLLDDLSYKEQCTFLLNRRKDERRRLVAIRFLFCCIGRFYLVPLFYVEKYHTDIHFNGYGNNGAISFVSKIFVYIFVFFFFILSLFVGLYLIKSGLGIDIYPGKHIFELFF